jgi:polysaccharide export outer membrane protein
MKARHTPVRWLLTLTTVVLAMKMIAAQSPQGFPAASPENSVAVVPVDYVIGPQDVLQIRFWRDADMSGDVTVRPDGKISIPLLNDIPAAGRTPEELRIALVAAASKYVEEPNPTVTVKEIHSRFVYITGNVARPASYAINGDLDVLKLITLAGGLLEYADSEKIQIIRTQNGKSEYHRFNYKDVLKQKNMQQNITLKPGDQVLVP